MKFAHNITKRVSLLALLNLALLAPIAPIQAATMNGAGSSAAAPLYNTWAEAYAKKNGDVLDYKPIGSSGGIKQIKAKEVDFGASDVALSPADLKKDQLIQFPSAISGVVPIVNLPGVKSGELRLTGDVLAAIFSRQIVSWNDAAITALNPEISLPKKNIEVIVRQDGSGTTYNYTDYLGKMSKDWQITYGKNFTITWHKDLTQVKGSSGIVATLKKTPYSISYVDYNYVLQDKLSSVQLKNRDGKFLEPTAESFAAALNASQWKSKAMFDEMLTDKPGPNAWPITMGTFVIMPQVTNNSDKTLAAIKFFTWGFMHGDRFVNHVDLVRLPDAIQARVFKEMTTIVDTNGKQLRWILE